MCMHKSCSSSSLCVRWRPVCTLAPRFVPPGAAVGAGRPEFAKRLFGETRSQTLADMVEGSLLLNFNNAKRRSEKEAGF